MAEAVVRCGECGLEPQRVAKRGGRLVPPPEIAVGDSQVVMRLDEIGSESARPFEAGRSVLGAAERLVGVAEVLLRPRVRRMKRERARDELGGAFMLSALEG